LAQPFWPLSAFSEKIRIWFNCFNLLGFLPLFLSKERKFEDYQKAMVTPL
jgi:hypothetical protein